MAWLTGVRVLEAIGVAFNTNKKYSEEPRLKTKQEVEEEEKQMFEMFAVKAKSLYKEQGKK